MNAVAIQSAPAPARNPRVTPVSQFRTLLRRELTEHRGSILYAPMILAAIQMIVTVVTSIVAYNKFRTTPASITVNGHTLEVPMSRVGELLAKLKPDDLLQTGRFVDGFLYASSMWPLLLAGLVAFFYCLGAIYDERKDRSLLFWKSMPISDTQSVAAKAVTALLVIPGIAMLVSAALVLTYALIGSVALLIVGGSPAVLWQHSNPFGVIGSIFASLPIHALWALPAAGWLLLCSAYAKRVPMLWAVGLPVVLGVIMIWAESGMSLGSSNFVTEGYFQHVVYRILPGIVPGSFVPKLEHVDLGANMMPYQMPVLVELYKLLLTPAIWLGVLAGIAMLALAIRQRRAAGVL